MKIGLASDHGGYNLKSEIIKHLKEKGIECIDFGPDNSLESVDYPIFGEKVANAVISKAVDYTWHKYHQSRLKIRKEHR